MKEFIDILLKPKVKYVIVGFGAVLLAIIPTILLPIKTWWSHAIMFLFAGLYIFVTVFYGKQEKNIAEEISRIEQTNEKITKQLRIYDELSQSFCALSKTDSSLINQVIHEIYNDTDGAVRLKVWNFQSSCDRMCEHIYTHVIKKICGDNANVGVGYVRLVEYTKDGKPVTRKNKGKYCELCSYYHPNINNPSIKGVQRKIERGNGAYHDATLFYDGKDAIDVLIDKQAIEGANGFYFKDEKHKDYSQYIGIPVFCCTSKNEMKMIGLLEIVCFENTKIANDVNSVKLIAETIFAVFAYYILIMYKIEKAILAKPKLNK